MGQPNPVRRSFIEHVDAESDTDVEEHEPLNLKGAIGSGLPIGRLEQIRLIFRQLERSR
jgi:hypothetical protein